MINNLLNILACSMVYIFTCRSYFGSLNRLAIILHDS